MAASDHPLDLLVRKLRLNCELSEADCAAIQALPYKMRSLEAASYLVRDGDPPVSCALLVSGFAFRQKTTGDGARQILALHVPGEAMDLQNIFLDVSDHNVQMLTRGTVANIPRSAFQNIAMERPAVGRAILVSTLIEASIFREWVLNIGRRDARSRIAHLLCEFAVRMETLGLKDGHGFDLPMTQEQLADATGLTPVHVNRVLKGLAAERLVSRNRRQISFPDWRQIRDVADFNTRYLHLSLEDS